MSNHAQWPMLAAASMYAPHTMSTTVVATLSSGNSSSFSSVAVLYCLRKKYLGSVSSSPDARTLR